MEMGEMLEMEMEIAMAMAIVMEMKIGVQLETELMLTDAQFMISGGVAWFFELIGGHYLYGCFRELSPSPSPSHTV